MALSALAGPVSNLLLALVFAGIQSIYLNLVAPNIVTVNNYMALYYIELFFLLGVRMNIALAVFNMIPVPPFNGSRILYVFLPPKYYFKVMKYERYIGIGILLAFIIASRFNIDLLGFVVNPIMDGIYWLVGLG
jgi:Zn-dependent protease